MSKVGSLKSVSYIYIYIYILTASLLSSLSIISFLFLTSSTIFATDHISNVSVKVPISCNIESTLDSPHTTTINPGQLKEDIGTTTFKVFCNDNTGYAIYAIGYSGNEYGNTNMLPTSTSNPSIVTGLATSGNTSNWTMKLTPIDGTYKPTIESDTNGSFSDYHIVPDKYTKVATLTSSTDFTIGSSFKSTYRVFVSQNQMADTYTGKVKYTIVHPNDAKPPKPIVPENQTAETLPGQEFNEKMGNSFGWENIKAIKMSDSLPTNFVANESNNFASDNSPNPIYGYYDNANDARILYFYTPAKVIKVNENAYNMFAELIELTDISGLAEWDTSNVTDMGGMFYNDWKLTELSALANWDTSNVTDMYAVFEWTAITDIDALSSWDTSNVTSMNCMFCDARSLTNIDGAANWDTSNVIYMSYMFEWTAITDIDALSSWDTSNVIYMYGMFKAVYSLTNVSGAKDWDTRNVTSIDYMFDEVDNIDATVLNNWNVSKVTSKTKAFTNPVDKQPCWYRGITCPTNSGNNSGNNTGNSTNQTNSTNHNNSPSFSYNGRGLDNSLDPISSPDSTSATSNSSPNNNTYGNTPNQTSPQGEISRIKSKNDYLKLLPLGLIIVSIIAFIIGVIFFLLKCRKDKDDESSNTS